MDPYRGLISDVNAFELAVWFHDAVYDPSGGGGGKNETESAQLFSEFAADAEVLGDALVAKVRVVVRSRLG